MQIQNISSFSFSKNNNQNKILNHRLNLMLPNDTISFSAKAERNSSDFSYAATKIGHEIYDMLLENKSQREIYSAIQSKAPDIRIRNINCLSELHIDDDDYAAYFSSKLGSDMHPEDMQMFLRSENPKSKIEKMLRAMDIAHEYTHYLQTSSGYDGNSYKKITNDAIYMSIIVSLGDKIFSIFDGEFKLQALYDIFKDSIDFRIMNIIPKVKSVTQQDILKGADVRNKSEFKKRIEAIYNQIFRILLKELIENPERIQPEFQEKFYETLKTQNSLAKLVEDVKKYCSICAQREKQALKTESILAKQIMKTTQPLNYDANYMYHELLERALA